MAEHAGAGRDDPLRHLEMARRFAAASIRVAKDNPKVARDLSEQSLEILAFVEAHDDTADAKEVPTGVLFFDEPAGPSFARFRQLLDGQDDEVIAPQRPVANVGPPAISRPEAGRSVLGWLRRFF